MITVEKFIYNASENKMIAFVFNPCSGTERRTVDTAAFSRFLASEACFTSRYFADDLESYFNACPTGRYACASIARFLQTQPVKKISVSNKNQFLMEREAEREYVRPNGWPFK